MTFTAHATHTAATAAHRRQAGRRPRFSADDVVRTAMELGLRSFSVAAVARELGVTTAAVYRRFPSHRALLEECINRILSEVAPLTEAVSWQDSLRRAADEWWALCLRYPELPQVVSGYANQVARFVAVPFRTYGRRLIEFGFSLQQTHFVASLLISTLDQIFRMPDDETRCPSRNFLRTRAVEIIVSGIDKDTDGWEIDGDRSAAQ
jgi:AcrR family transcriptional regulator